MVKLNMMISTYTVLFKLSKREDQCCYQDYLVNDEGNSDDLAL